jgi:hypothetical protein
MSFRRWARGELCYFQAWAWVGCGVILKYLGLAPVAIACFGKGVHCAHRASAVFGAKP